MHLAERLREAAQLASEIGPSEARGLLPQVAALALALAARAAEERPEAARTQVAESPARAEWMNASQVEALYGLDRAWLAEHARELERAGLVAKPSRKVRLYHRARLGRWIEARRAAPERP